MGLAILAVPTVEISVDLGVGLSELHVFIVSTSRIQQWSFGLPYYNDFPQWANGICVFSQYHNRKSQDRHPASGRGRFGS
jgi:hypothetical protein